MSLAVRDVTGRVVRNLASGERGAGEHAIFWDGCDERGVRYAAGLFFVDLRAGGLRRAERVTLLR